MTDTPEAAQVASPTLCKSYRRIRVFSCGTRSARHSRNWDKAKKSAPAFGLAAAAGVLGLFAAAASYRLSVKLLEKLLPPVPAAMVAAAVTARAPLTPEFWRCAVSAICRRSFPPRRPGRPGKSLPRL